jgi:hypothetical protein
MKVHMLLRICSSFFIEHSSNNNKNSETATAMALWSDILGVVVRFAGLGAASVLRKLIIYNWPASKIGKFLVWSPPSPIELGPIELGDRSAEFILMERLVKAEEGMLELMRESRKQKRDRDVDDDELTSETDHLSGAMR